MQYNTIQSYIAPKVAYESEALVGREPRQRTIPTAFSALALLDERQEERLTCKKLVNPIRFGESVPVKNLVQMGASQRVSERAFHGNFLNLLLCCGFKKTAYLLGRKMVQLKAILVS